MKNLVRNSFIALAVTIAIICASIILSSCLTSCAKVEKPVERNTFTVNVDKIYIDEEQDVAILIIGDNQAGVEIKSDISINAVYALLEEKEEIVLSSDTTDIYLYAEDNL